MSGAPHRYHRRELGRQYALLLRFPRFYPIREFYRAEQLDAWKANLALNGQYSMGIIFIYTLLAYVSRPDGYGLRHLVFSADDFERTIGHLQAAGVVGEPARFSPYTQSNFTFLNDPDDLPLELLRRECLIAA